MIITVFSRKSGPGKTTFACSIAAYLNNSWRKVCIVDADPQCSAKRWGERRIADFIEEDKIEVYPILGDLETELVKLNKSYEFVLVDCAGRDSIELRSSLFVADLAVMVTLPSFLDREHYSYMSNVIEEFQSHNKKLKVKTVISLVTEEDAEEVNITRKYLNKFKLRPVGATVKSRVDFKKVMEYGLGGTESDISGVSTGMTKVIKEVLS
jgi:chromosome partitioning protein